MSWQGTLWPFHPSMRCTLKYADWVGLRSLCWHKVLTTAYIFIVDIAEIPFSLVATGNLDKGAIFNAEGTSAWAASPGFTVRPALTSSHLREPLPLIVIRWANAISNLGEAHGMPDITLPRSRQRKWKRSLIPMSIAEIRKRSRALVSTLQASDMWP